jgi:CDP-diacylglycerol--glycerol-3-phosphate 3-phosphatidyltransferase
MKLIPLGLIYSRFFIGLLILSLSIIHIEFYPQIAVSLLIIGLLTDIFDGIVARRLNISTQRLRRLDSNVDQCFFIAVALATYIQCPAFFSTNYLWIGILLAAEGLTYLISFLKFKKEIATHSIGAKLWTLVLVATLIDIMLHCQSSYLFMYCFWIGVITRIEITAIILTLKNWTNDVPTIYHAWQLRNGKEIKKHKLFNG